MTRLAILLAGLLMRASVAAAIDVPTLRERVTDLAGVLTAAQKAALDSKLRDLESTDSTQVAVLIIPSLEGESLEGYSLRVAEAWKIGQKGRDNGVILLVSMKERKIRIEVGYGLESILTDALSSRIIRNQISPRFKQGDFYGGIDAGVTAITQVVRGAYHVPADEQEQKRRSEGFSDFPIVLLFPLFWVLSAAWKWGSSIMGAIVGSLLPYTLIGPIWPLILLGGVIGAFLGYLFGLLIRATGSSGRGSRGAGGPFIWTSGSGGFFGGGGFSGRGGFSGGGGRFGGGGSSGSW